MNTTRRRYSAEFKFHVALDAAKGQQTTSELASKYEVHPNQISTWKRELLEGGAGFSPARAGVAAKSANRRHFRRIYTSRSANSRLSWSG